MAAIEEPATPTGPNDARPFGTLVEDGVDLRVCGRGAAQCTISDHEGHVERREPKSISSNPSCAENRHPRNRRPV
jgi:hypothetical protein